MLQRPHIESFFLHYSALGFIIFNSNVSQLDVANAIRGMHVMFRGCDLFDCTFATTWPLPNEPSVEALFPP
jgi:hypothetical protein